MYALACAFILHGVDPIYPTKKPTPLRLARARAGLTQAALAAKAGLTLGTVSLVERTGYATPSTAAKLAEALGVAAEELHS